jgi:hypothetical protein
VRAVGQLRDLAKATLGFRIVALLEEKGAHAEQAQLTGNLTDLVELLLEAVADEDEGRDPLLLGLAHRMLEHAADLGLPGQAEHAAHQADQIARIVDPAARPAFVEAAVVHQLHVEAAERCGLEEHLSLDLAGAIPGRLARRRGVHGEDQARPTASRLGRRGPGHLLEKGLDRIGRGFAAWQVLVAHRGNVC